jgi:RND family efflux transporter MFP subunit
MSPVTNDDARAPRSPDEGSDPGSDQIAVSKVDLSALRMDRDELIYRPRQRWVAPVIILALLAAGAAWAVLTPAPFLLPKVATTTVQVVTPTEASTVLTATGYTYARDRAAVGSRVIGRVVELKVDEGDRVRRGDVIAVLDSEDLRASIRQGEAELLETRAQLADAEREAGRQQRLSSAGVTAQSENDAALTARDVARARVQTAQARLDSLRAQLAYTVIRSPLDGVVIERNVEVGEMVAPGGFTSQQSTGAIVRIADPTSLEVEADINESYIARVQLGQPASIKVDAVPDRQYRGRLRQIVPTADRQKAVVQVKVAFDDADERLVPDMSSTVTFLETAADEAKLAAAKPRMYLPAAAVRKDGGESVVFVVEEDVLRRTPVELGAAEKDQVEVLSGLTGGETVVRGGLDGLADGKRVRRAEG